MYEQSYSADMIQSTTLEYYVPSYRVAFEAIGATSSCWILCGLEILLWKFNDKRE